MKLLRIPASKRGNSITVLLFGVGLIGSAIERGLTGRYRAVSHHYPYDWQNACLRAKQTEALEAALGEKHDTGPEHIAFVWAGGRSDFTASAEQMQRETALVKELIAFAHRLRQQWIEARFDFHLLSSAGGLFEGQIICAAETEPQPLRPYGDGKLAQEHLLKAAGFDRCRIYRPSSVYGTTRSGRVGLISALVSNAIHGRVTRIFGGINTLRDFVWAEDIGRHIARRVADKTVCGELPVQVELLADGRSASMFEVIGLVERAVERPLELQFDPSPSNARNMSFLPSALPRDWRRTDLTTGVAQVVINTRRHLCIAV